MPSHLPPDEMLADYACGATTPGMTLLLAAHLTHSAESRAKVREFERIGGVLLSEESEAPMSMGALDAVMAKLNGAPVEAIAPARRLDQGPLPAPLIDQIGSPFGAIPWKTRLPGVAMFELDGFADENVTLLRARPGARVPQHTHEGSEITLVMQGILSDDGVDYHAGDVAVNDHHDEHRPYARGDETCYCLIVQEGDLKFTGTFSRVLNFLGE